MRVLLAFFRRRKLRIWIGYLLLALVALSLESGDELLGFIGLGECNSATLEARMLYQRFATAGYRKPRPHFVRLVVLSKTSVPKEVLASPCRKREFVSTVLRRVASLSPALIVLDFSYSREVCRIGDDADGTTKLQDAIRDVSQHIPIVIGADSQTEHELRMNKDQDLPSLKEKGFTSRDQILDPLKLLFDANNVSYGLYRLDCDTRRIPIFWWVYPDKAAVMNRDSRVREPTLAYSAASQYDRDLSTALRTIISKDEHPFTSFVPESKFRPVPAMLLVCGHELRAAEDWRNCTADFGKADVDSLKGGKIILIGENSEYDQHESVFDEVPGYILQANYIEALLDDRYFRPIWPLAELCLAAIGILLVVIVFELCSSLLAGFFACVGLVTLISAICSLLSIYTGYFLAFWMPLVLVPFLEVLYGMRVRAGTHTATNGNTPQKLEEKS
jgi:hypothetical protein